MKNNLNNVNNIVSFFFSALRVAIASPHQSDHQTVTGRTAEGKTSEGTKATASEEKPGR